MDYFNYQKNQFYAESVPLTRIAEEVGTPCYVYSRATLERHWHAFNDSLGGHSHLICYAVKANANVAILNLFARLGSGFDIVSRGELERVIHAGGALDKVIFSGVGKTENDLRFALQHNIHCFNVESIAELDRLNNIAQQMGKKAPIALRVNPDVDAGTHPYISTGLKENKFGIDIKSAFEIYQYASNLTSVNIHGIACHIGSQLTDLTPFLDALDRVLALLDQLTNNGIQIQHLDLGGGLGIRYQNESPPLPEEYVAAIKNKLSQRDISIHLEPGRAIAGNAGILLTRIEYIKQNENKNFAIVDAAMNDLLRPSLYNAWQEILPVVPQNHHTQQTYDVVGPVCETGDFLGKNRQLSIAQGDLLAVRSSGAYGFCMSSNYNSRPRAAEVLVDGNHYHIIRQRETFNDLIKGESLIP